MGLENYTRVRKLGKGSFGEVFLVVDKRNNQQYVMKEVDLVQFGPKGRKEALKEVGFLNAMHHPFIVAYREFFEQDPGNLGRKFLYIIMEFADGGDLDGRIKQASAAGKYFAEPVILNWFVQICLAVKHIHDRKIIHRDLKCENIFLAKSTTSTSSSASVVKLGDFGISKSMAHTMAHAMTRIGTPYYLSPEICMNKPYNMKSDMWSLGVILYELISLKHAFDGTSMENLLNKIVKTQPAPLPKHFSIEIRTIVDSLLSKQPNKRPTVNSLLKLPFLLPYVNKNLSQEQMQEEFSHTVIHSDPTERGQNQAKFGVQIPVSNQVAAKKQPSQQPQQQQQQQPLPPPQHQNRLPPARPQQPMPQQQHILHQQPQQPSFQHYPEHKERDIHTPSRQPLSYRPSSGERQTPVPSSAYPPASAHSYPPSPYAGLSNADKIRAIREKREQELREAKYNHQQGQQEAARRRQAAEEKLAEEDERERQRMREAQKERQLQEQMRVAHSNDHQQLPPALRPREVPSAAPGQRGIPSVRRDGSYQSGAATPLYGAPYQDRAPPHLPAAAAQPSHPGRMQQQQVIEQQRRLREEELTRQKVSYFKDRKAKREAKLQTPVMNGPPPRQAAPAAAAAYPRMGGGSYLPSRPPSSDRYQAGHTPIVIRQAGGPNGKRASVQNQSNSPYAPPIPGAGSAPRWR